jgi:hypothetical protein
MLKNVSINVDFSELNKQDTGAYLGLYLEKKNYYMFYYQ